VDTDEESDSGTFFDLREEGDFERDIVLNININVKCESSIKGTNVKCMDQRHGAGQPEKGWRRVKKIEKIEKISKIEQKKIRNQQSLTHRSKHVGRLECVTI
jgi:hypothetical protein